LLVNLRFAGTVLYVTTHAPGLLTETRLTPGQVGVARPSMPIGLVEQLRETIEKGTLEAQARWTEDRLWLSKSSIGTALRCEGQMVADRSEKRRPGLHPTTAIGILAHRAVALSHTHPGRSVGEYVSAARGAAMNESSFAAYWDTADIAAQSDLISGAVSKTTIFLDSFPPLLAQWNPRFEESLQARVGKLVLSAKPDFVLGRPSNEGRQSMFLADLKTGALNDDHFDEAMFYALVATLRFGVAPWRSVVFSLASGEWSDPDVTKARLMGAANRVVAATVAMCDVLTDKRSAALTSGRWCNWCPAKDTCPAFGVPQESGVLTLRG
jgi:hypothetical protein